MFSLSLILVVLGSTPFKVVCFIAIETRLRTCSQGARKRQLKNFSLPDSKL